MYFYGKPIFLQCFYWGLIARYSNAFSSDLVISKYESCGLLILGIELWCPWAAFKAFFILSLKPFFCREAVEPLAGVVKAESLSEFKPPRVLALASFSILLFLSLNISSYSLA